MNIDLTELFTKAFRVSNDWQPNRFKVFINSIENNENLKLSWDQSVPENWIEINREGKPIAVVRRTFPFAFVLESHFRFLYPLMSNNNILYIKISDFNQNGFMLDKNKIDMIFPEKFSDFVNPEDFSLQELFYGTI
ncbi:MAG: hypothetical protein Phog2KO_48380 [Phototrophicaceae bacterium]